MHGGMHESVLRPVLNQAVILTRLRLRPPHPVRVEGSSCGTQVLGRRFSGVFGHSVWVGQVQTHGEDCARGRRGEKQMEREETLVRGS
jgi:hypothetical protein